MAESSKTINPNQAIAGINQNNIPEQITPGTLTYALNAMVDSFDGDMVTYQNEQSNVLCTEFKAGYKVIGVYSIPEQSRTILCLTNPITKDCEIGIINSGFNNLSVCDYDNPTNLNKIESNTYVNNGYNICPNNLDLKDIEENKEILSFYETYKKLNPGKSIKNTSCCVYTTLVQGKCLNFNINFPIKRFVHEIVASNNSNDNGVCGTIIYFADGNNPLRYLNIDSLPFRETIIGCDRVKSNVLDCDLMRVQPLINPPIIDLVSSNDGGSLIAGSYQFAIQYTNSNSDGLSEYFSITNAVTIFKQVYGLNYNFETDKSIKISISNLDTNFKFYNLAVIKTINGVSQVNLVGTYPVTKTIEEITYTGTDKTEINLTIEDIFEKYPYYDSASLVLTSGDILMWAGLKANKRINYQSIANKIRLKWVSYKLPYNKSEGYTNGINSAKLRGYMRDEVYGFEFVPIIKKGGKEADGFHIPSRESIPSDLTSVTNDDVINLTEDGCIFGEEELVPRWKVYNTATNLGSHPNYPGDSSCYKGPYQYGEFSYWESEKKYPCNSKIWGELSDKPIRHHKFPDNLVSDIFDSVSDNKDREHEHSVYPLGIMIDMENIKNAILQSDLTTEEKENIVGFKIIRTDRTNSKSVVAKGLLYNAGVYTPYDEEGDPSIDQQIFYPNYPFNDLRQDPFLTNLSTINNEGLDVSSVSALQNTIENSGYSLDFINSLLSVLLPQCYTATDTCIVDTSGTPIIEITYSDISDLKTLIITSKNLITTALNDLQTILDYINNKIDNNIALCVDDVAALTLLASRITDIQSSISDIDSSSTISLFVSTISFIEANTAALESHPSATDIFNLKSLLQQIIDSKATLDTAEADINIKYTNYTAFLTALSGISCDIVDVSESLFSQNRMTFHSPDTHFYQPYLGSYLKFESLYGGVSIGNFVEVEDNARHKMRTANDGTLALLAGTLVGALFALNPKAHVYGFGTAIGTAYYPSIWPDIGTIAEKALFWQKEFNTLIDNILPFKNYGYQYNAIGNYNQHSPVPNDGFKQRIVDKAYYLLPGHQSFGDVAPINNWNRESSVYFRTVLDKTSPRYPNDAAIIGDLHEDDSRVLYSPDKQIYSNVLSYYASNKKLSPDQYGDIYSYQTIDTGYNGKIDLTKNYTTDNSTRYVSVFGGDIFINRFGLKRKLSYYIDNGVGKSDGIDINYNSLSNIGKTTYWYNSTSTQIPGTGFKGLIDSLLRDNPANLDGNTNKFFYKDGRIYLYSYGIAYFFVESEVNIENRQAGNNTDKDFYPNVGTGIPNDWLQEKTVPIANDNYYIYNKSYSKQNRENYFSHLPIDFNPYDLCRQDYTNRVFYSDLNKWRTYKPISYFDFPGNYGKLIGIDSIGNTQILVRFENKSYIYNALSAIQTSSGKYAYLGNDDVFKSQPIDFGETDLGYAGSQHNFLLKTRAGDLYLDSKNSTIFLFNGKDNQPISESGMSKWLQKNLPFNINKYFPEVDIDNTYAGIGITGVWDDKHERFLITKLDYKPLDQYKDNLRYEKESNKFYYGNREVLLEDPKYFCNKSWTISYHVGTKSFISLHSYLPNFYISYNNSFVSGINNMIPNQNSSIWIHNLIHTDYQTFYGKLYPYILEYPFAYKAQDEILQSVQDYTTILEYYNENEFYEINDDIYFNKAVLYNNQQCSGIRNLIPKPKNRLNLYLAYPKINKDSIDILYTKSNNIFNYNHIWDTVLNSGNHIPIWIDSCENKSVDKVLNNLKLDYSSRSFQKTKLKAKNLRIRHIQDKYSRYKFISKFVLTENQISFK